MATGVGKEGRGRKKEEKKKELVFAVTFHVFHFPAIYVLLTTVETFSLFPLLLTLQRDLLIFFPSPNFLPFGF